jgi:hypothetical protein
VVGAVTCRSIVSLMKLADSQTTTTKGTMSGHTGCESPSLHR